MAISNNKKGGTAQIVLSGSGTVALTDLALTGETVTGFTILNLFWSTAGTITLTRGSDVINLNGSGSWPLTYFATPYTLDANQPLVAVVPANSTVILEVRKDSTFVSETLGAN